MIVGGWSYVWSAYLVTWIGLALYAASLWSRKRQVERELRGNDKRTSQPS
jgi:heme exporter protein CcmD